MKLNNMTKGMLVCLSLFAVIGCKKTGKEETAAEASAAQSAETETENIAENPASDFEYALTDDMSGVKIVSYKGERVNIRIPSEIEGMPVVELGESIFFRSGSNDKVASVIVPDSVTKLDEAVFSGSKSLRKVVLPEHITNLPSGAFSGCAALTSYIIPKHIKTIETSVFSGSGLESIVIPDDVTFIARSSGFGPGYVFSGCRELRSVTLPSTLTEIPDYMFDKCESLLSIDIPATVTRIGAHAFSGCTALDELIIPDSVVSIGKDAFDNLKVTSLVIPDSVTDLQCVFNTCKELESIHLPNSLTKIPNDMFWEECTKIKSLNLPESVTTIGEKAFSKMYNLEEVIIPDSLQSVSFTIYGNDSESFKDSKLPLATQKRLRDLGYTGRFRN